MGVYVYCIRENYWHQSSIKGREFENEWFTLSKDGAIIVKGTHYKGYAWDGCSPKFKIKDLYLGTSEAVLNFTTGESKTYYASLIHDIFYQFSKNVRSFIPRGLKPRHSWRGWLWPLGHSALKEPLTLVQQDTLVGSPGGLH